MKKFTIPCDFAGEKAPFAIYIGENDEERHPLYFQSRWLDIERGGKIPPEVMDSFMKLSNIANENSTSYEELCMYALGGAAEEKVMEKKAIIDGKEVATLNYYGLESFVTYYTGDRLFKGNRKYRQVFLRHETGYLNFELKLSNKLYGWMDWHPAISFKGYTITNNEESEEPIFDFQLKDTVCQKTISTLIFTSGWGNTKPGYWKSGHYRVKSIIDEDKAAEYDFYVNDFEGIITSADQLALFDGHMFYESAKNDEDMKYFTNQYPADQTRYVNFRMKFKNLWLKSSWYAELRVLVFTETFELKAAFSQIKTVPVDQANPEFIISNGYGTQNPAFWTKGKYLFKFFLFELFVVEEWIELT